MYTFYPRWPSAHLSCVVYVICLFIIHNTTQTNSRGICRLLNVIQMPPVLTGSSVTLLQPECTYIRSITRNTQVCITCNVCIRIYGVRFCFFEGCTVRMLILLSWKDVSAIRYYGVASLGTDTFRNGYVIPPWIYICEMDENPRKNNTYCLYTSPTLLNTHSNVWPNCCVSFVLLLSCNVQCISMPGKVCTITNNNQ